MALAALSASPSPWLLMALVVMSHRQIDYWGDNVTLWSYTLQVTNRNYEAEEDLGEALLAKAAWSSVHRDQLEKFKRTFPPEYCIGRPLARIGILNGDGRVDAVSEAA